MNAVLMLRMGFSGFLFCEKLRGGFGWTVEVCGRFIDDVKFGRMRAWKGKEKRKKKSENKAQGKIKETTGLPARCISRSIVTVHVFLSRIELAPVGDEGNREKQSVLPIAV